MGKTNNNLSVKDATHKLTCRHKCGSAETIYSMPCIPLGKTKAGKLKIMVFGRLFWTNSYDKKQIRYVDDFRVVPNGLTGIQQTIPRSQ